MRKSTSATRNIPIESNCRTNLRAQGRGFLSPFHGDHSDVSFTARLLAHWANLDQRKPTVRIVCRNYCGRPLYGMHGWDCPNLLWELTRTRRELLTAQQVLNRNTSEAIVQKDDHSRDACKYVLLSHPGPSKKSYDARVADRMQKAWKEKTPTEAMLELSKIQEEEREADSPVISSYYGCNIRHYLAEEERKRREARARGF